MKVTICASSPPPLDIEIIVLVVPLVVEPFAATVVLMDSSFDEPPYEPITWDVLERAWIHYSSDITYIPDSAPFPMHVSNDIGESMRLFYHIDSDGSQGDIRDDNKSMLLDTTWDRKFFYYESSDQ